MFQKATIIKDDWNTWFVIPNNMVNEFRKHRSDSQFVHSGDFNRKYSKYMLGWNSHQCSDHVQIYIEIEE
jgi:hypothetical protein